MLQLIDTLSSLELFVRIWPPLQEQRFLYAKIGYTAVIDQSIAGEPGQRRPRTLERSKWQDIPAECRVYKREWSAESKHVRLPEANHKAPTKNNKNPFDVWFAQDYNKHIREIGEIRIVVARCSEIIATVLTEPKGTDWTRSTLTAIASLSEIRARYAFHEMR